MTQERLATELVHKHGLKEGRTKSVPMSTSIKLVQAEEDQLLDREEYHYSELVGSLLYLSVCTRPDISQAVGVLARHMAKPSMEHWTAAKAVLRCIAGTLGCGITFRQTDIAVGGYSDADYAGDSDTRRSTTGFVFILERRSYQLEQQTAAYNGSLNHRSRVHGLSSGSQGGTLAQETAG